MRWFDIFKYSRSNEQSDQDESTYGWVEAETESIMSEEKRNSERKRNIIILIEKYLLGLGCLESVIKLEQESLITLEKWDAADNIDLFMIFIEYEQYYEARFGKTPKVVKKVEDTCTSPSPSHLRETQEAGHEAEAAQ